MGDTIVYIAGQLVSGQIEPECSAIIGDSEHEIIIKGVVLVHPPNRPADEVTLMVEHLPIRDQDIIGKDLFSKPANGNLRHQ